MKGGQKKMGQAERDGEIASGVAEYIGQHLLTLKPDEVRKELSKISNITGIPIDELISFLRRVLKRMIDRIFSE